MTAVAGPPAVRLALAKDAPDLEAIERACFHAPWSRADLVAMLGGGAAALVLAAKAAHSAPGLSGYAAFQRAATEAELLRLAVLEPERRRGVATALIEVGLERLERTGVTEVWLEVAAANTAALALYHHFGFRAVGSRPRYYRDGADALVLSLALPRPALGLPTHRP